MFRLHLVPWAVWTEARGELWGLKRSHPSKGKHFIIVLYRDVFHRTSHSKFEKLLKIFTTSMFCFLFPHHTIPFLLFSYISFLFPFTFHIFPFNIPFYLFLPFLTSETWTLGYVIFLVSYKSICCTRYGCDTELLATFTLFFDKLNFALGGLPSKAKYISTKTKKIHFSEGE